MLAGVKDLSRPAEKLSVSQNVALAATGFIWVGLVVSWLLITRSTYGVTDLLMTSRMVQVRYSFVITPVNYSLAAVNFFVGATGVAQLYRVWDYRRKNPGAVSSA